MELRSCEAVKLILARGIGEGEGEGRLQVRSKLAPMMKGDGESGRWRDDANGGKFTDLGGGGGEAGRRGDGYIYCRCLYRSCILHSSLPATWRAS